MATHESPLDMLEYKIQSDDVQKTCSSNLDEVKQINYYNMK